MLIQCCLSITVKCLPFASESYTRTLLLLQSVHHITFACEHTYRRVASSESSTLSVWNLCPRDMMQYACFLSQYTHIHLSFVAFSNTMTQLVCPHFWMPQYQLNSELIIVRKFRLLVVLVRKSSCKTTCFVLKSGQCLANTLVALLA